MKQESNDFDALEALLVSARRQVDVMRERSAVRRIARTREEVSEDYASRLAERATFRRLLSDEALDGVRFRFLFQQGIPQMYRMWTDAPGRNLDDFRKWVDEQIAGKEGINGPQA